jgi:hypothetical protein
MEVVAEEPSLFARLVPGSPERAGAKWLTVPPREERSSRFRTDELVHVSLDGRNNLADNATVPVSPFFVV